MQFRCTLVLLLTTTISVPGCLSGSRVNELSTEGIEAINNVPRTIIGAARSAPNANQGVLDTYEGALENRISAQAGRLQEMHDQLVAEEKAWKDALMGIAQTVASAVGIQIPGGASLQDSLTAAFGQIKKDTKATADEAVKPVEGKLVAMATRLTDAEKYLTELKDKFKDTKAEQEKAAFEFFKSFDKETETKLQNFFREMEQETKQKLAAVSTDTMEKLKAAKEDREKFEKLLADEAKLTPDEIQKFKGFTTEQIIALIGAAGAAVAAGIAGGRSGKSRSQPEIDDLYDKLSALTTDIALFKNPPKT